MRSQKERPGLVYWAYFKNFYTYK